MQARLCVVSNRPLKETRITCRHYPQREEPVCRYLPNLTHPRVWAGRAQCCVGHAV